MKIYKETIEAKKEELERWNFLLSKDIDDMSKEEKEKYQPKKFDQIGCFEINFKDGSYITIDVNSGSQNYYDDIIWRNPSTKEIRIFDCFYEIKTGEMELYVYNDDCEEKEKCYIISLNAA